MHRKRERGGEGREGEEKGKRGETKEGRKGKRSVNLFSIKADPSAGFSSHPFSSTLSLSSLPLPPALRNPSPHLIRLVALSRTRGRYKDLAETHEISTT